MNTNSGIAISTSFDITEYARCTIRSRICCVGELRIDAAVGEPAEEHAHAHQRERGREAEHDRDDDQRQHQQAERAEIVMAQVAVDEAGPRREDHDRDQDDRHQREAEPQFLADLHFVPSLRQRRAGRAWRCPRPSRGPSPSACRRRLPRTSSSRDGHSPCLMQITQRMISTMPCSQQERAGQRQDRLERIDRRAFGGDVRVLADRPATRRRSSSRHRSARTRRE